jgi:hypothetical protein
MHFSSQIAKLSASDTIHGMKTKYRGADKSLARPTSRCVLFDG